MLAGAAAVTLAVWQGWPAAAMAVILLWVCRAPGVLLGVVVLLSAAGVVRGEQAWASAVPRHLGAYRGWAELASDPTPFGGAVRVTVEIEAMEGKLKRLRELIAFSTMTVRFEARGGETVTKKIRLPFPWLDQLGLSHLLNL